MGGQELARSFGADTNSLEFTDLRRESASFLAKLRQHHAEEVDLIYESFWTDIGVGD